MAPQYSFPILSNHEITACLGELDIPLEEQDLLKPHPDTLYRAYEEIVCLLCGQTREAMYAPNLDAVDVLEFPELYEDAIGNLRFHRHLFELMV
jgi:kinetochore protein Nuf2